MKITQKILLALVLGFGIGLLTKLVGSRADTLPGASTLAGVAVFFFFRTDEDKSFIPYLAGGILGFVGWAAFVLLTQFTILG